MDEWNKARKEWLATAQRGSRHTGRAYAAALRDFEGFVTIPLSEVKGADVAAWANDLARRGLAGSTINVRLSALSSFYSFCRVVYGLVSANPVALVKRNKVALYGNSRPLMAEQVRALLGVVDRSTVQGVRDYAMLLMAVFTGRRSEEIRTLRWGDIQHVADGRVRYHWRGKGGKGQWADLPPPVYQAISVYLEVAGRKPGMGELVFVSHNGRCGKEPLTGEWFNMAVRGYCAEAGLPGWVTTHSLRHTAANLRDQTGQSLQEISQMLGHSSLRVTQIYLEAQRGFVDEGWEQVEELINEGG